MLPHITRAQKNVGPHTPCYCTWHAAQLSCSNVHVLDGAAQHPPRGEHVCPHTLLEQTRKQAGSTTISIGPCRRRRPLRLTCHCDACRGWVCGTPSVCCYTTRTPPSRRGCLVMTRRGAPPPSTPRGWYFGATATANPTAHLPLRTGPGWHPTWPLTRTRSQASSPPPPSLPPQLWDQRVCPTPPPPRGRPQGGGGDVAGFGAGPCYPRRRRCNGGLPHGQRGHVVQYPPRVRHGTDSCVRSPRAGGHGSSPSR